MTTVIQNKMTHPFHYLLQDGVKKERVKIAPGHSVEVDIDLEDFKKSLKGSPALLAMFDAGRLACKEKVVKPTNDLSIKSGDAKKPDELSQALDERVDHKVKAEVVVDTGDLQPAQDPDAPKGGRKGSK